jgi:hypothetical protein
MSSMFMSSMFIEKSKKICSPPQGDSLPDHAPDPANVRIVVQIRLRVQSEDSAETRTKAVRFHAGHAGPSWITETRKGGFDDFFGDFVWIA